MPMTRTGRRCLRASWCKDYYTTCVECIFGVTDIDSAIEDLNTRYNAAYDKLVDGGAERIVYPNFDPLKQDTAK